MAEDIVEVMVRRIVERFHPLRVLLFGSRARGEARKWSDVDLLVVLPEVMDKRKTTVEILRVLGDLPVSKDISSPHPKRFHDEDI